MNLPHLLRYRIPKTRFGEIERGTLLEQMLGAREQKLLVLAAGSGFGKSTALAQYARHHLNAEVFHTVVWLSLSEDENDPDVFLSSLAEAVLRALPRGTSVDLRQLDDLPPRQGTAVLARQLNRLDFHLLLVLDGGHALGEGTLECLEILLRELAEGHQVCLSIYETASFPVLASMVARGEAMVFEEQSLGFSRAETTACLAIHGRTGLDLEAQDRLEGWPIAVGLVGAGLVADLKPVQLIEHMLQRLPSHLLSILEQVALCEFWSEAGPSALGLVAPPQWLRHTRKSGLPIAALGNGQFRPHRLLTEVLVCNLERNPDRFQAASRLAASRAEDASEDLSAVRHYRNAGCLDDALRLVHKITARSQLQHQFHLTRQVLEEFHRDLLPPVLLERLGSALYEIGLHNEGIALLEPLHERHLLPLDKIGPLIDHLLRQGRSEAAQELIEHSLALANDDLTWANIALHQATLLFNHSRYADMHRLMSEVLPRAERGGDPFLLGSCLASLAVSLLGQGRYQEAMPILERTIHFSDVQQVPLRSLRARLNLVLTLMRQGRLDEALGHIERAALLAEAARHPRWPDVMKERANVLYQMGDTAGAFAVIQNTLQHADAVLFTLPQRTLLWLAAHKYAQDLGNFTWQAEAWRHIQTLLLEIPTVRFPHLEYLHAEMRTIEAKAAFVKHRNSGLAWTKGALATTRAAFTAALDSHGDIPNLQAELFLAELERLEHGRVSEKTVAFLIGRVTQIGGPQTLLQYQKDLPELFATAQREGWWSMPVRAPHQAAGHHRLEIGTLGNLSVRLNDHEVRMPFLRCAELLVWLAMHGPASRDQMLDALWDGSSDPAKAEYLRVILRQVRLTLTAAAGLGFNPILYHKMLYQLHPALGIQLDVHALQAGRTRTDPPALVAALEQYQGAFLPGVDSEWAGQVRLEAQEAALVAALRLGALLEPSDPDAAIRAYQRAVDLEPFSELAYAALNRLYAARGDQTGLEVVRRLKRINGLTD